MKTHELVKTNAELQEYLNKENESYYGDLLVYIRTNNFFRSDSQTEELLLEVLKDILDAQEKGVSAQEYFGDNPKEIADEMIQNLRPNYIESFKNILGYIGMFALFSLLPTLVNPNKLLDMGQLFLAGLFASVFAIILVMFIGKESYMKSKKIISLNIFLLVAVIVLFSLTFMISTPFKLDTSGSNGIALIFLLLGVLFVMFYRQENKKIWAPFTFPIVTATILGILLRINSFSDYFETSSGKTIVIGLLIMSLVLFYGTTFFVFKKLQRSENKK